MDRTALCHWLHLASYVLHLELASRQQAIAFSNKVLPRHGGLMEKMQPASRKSVVLHLSCLRLDCLEPKRGALVRLNDGEAHGFIKLRPSVVPYPGHTSVPCLFRPTHKGKPVGMKRTLTSTSDKRTFQESSPREKFDGIRLRPRSLNCNNYQLIFKQLRPLHQALGILFDRTLDNFQ